MIPRDRKFFLSEGCESSRASRRQRRFLTSEEIAAIIANLAPTIATQKAVREAEKAAREAEEAAREAKEAARQVRLPVPLAPIHIDPQKILVTINPGAVWLNRLLTGSFHELPTPYLLIFRTTAPAEQPDVRQPAAFCSAAGNVACC